MKRGGGDKKVKRKRCVMCGKVKSIYWMVRLANDWFCATCLTNGSGEITMTKRG